MEDGNIPGSGMGGGATGGWGQGIPLTGTFRVLVPRCRPGLWAGLGVDPRAPGWDMEP